MSVLLAFLEPGVSYIVPNTFTDLLWFLVIRQCVLILFGEGKHFNMDSRGRRISNEILPLSWDVPTVVREWDPPTIRSQCGALVLHLHQLSRGQVSSTLTPSMQNAK